MLQKINIFTIVLIIFCFSCTSQNYNGMYTRPHSEKVMGDFFILNQDSSFQSYLSTIDYGISTLEKKGKYLVLKNEFIILYPDSLKEINNLPFKVIDYDTQKYYTDTFSIILKDQDCILFGNWRCYIRQDRNKLIDKDKYHKLCNGVSSTNKYGH